MSFIPKKQKHFAVVGAGMAGVACARTLVQAGHRVTVFEKSRGLGGRMATRESAFGSFDHGTQYFTARDARFICAMETTPKLCKRWSANSVQVLDELGHVKAMGLAKRESHWVGAPGMKSLVAGWAEPLKSAGSIQMQTRIMQITPDALNPKQWQLHSESMDGTQHVYSGFDAVLLAIPSAQAQHLLQTSQLATPWVKQIEQVKVAPCWTLMLAFPQAMQPGMSAFGPQWNAALSTHHRIAWLSRESSKPGRDPIERWTVQASPAWSQEHMHDDPTRAQAKLIKAFSEVTGIRAEPAHVDSQRWLYAKTLRPLGKTHLWDAKKGLGVAGDWCIGHRVEDAFVSGLELALSAM
jgi:predicted NAD/FAD-dependent oxidoreductase